MYFNNEIFSAVQDYKMAVDVTNIQCFYEGVALQGIVWYVLGTSTQDIYYGVD